MIMRSIQRASIVPETGVSWPPSAAASRTSSRDYYLIYIRFFFQDYIFCGN